jgi:hypothetical protein
VADTATREAGTPPASVSPPAPSGQGAAGDDYTGCVSAGDVLGGHYCRDHPLTEEELLARRGLTGGYEGVPMPPEVFNARRDDVARMRDAQLPASADAGTAQHVTIVTPAWTADELVEIVEARVAGHWLTREQGDREIAEIRQRASAQQETVTHPERLDVLLGVRATSVTRQIIGVATEGGLRPHLDPADARATRIVVNGQGRDALFGAIYISRQTGRILRAVLTHGNNGEERRYEGAAAVRTVLTSWLALQRSRTADHQDAK